MSKQPCKTRENCVSLQLQHPPILSGSGASPLAGSVHMREVRGIAPPCAEAASSFAQYASGRSAQEAGSTAAGWQVADSHPTRKATLLSAVTDPHAYPYYPRESEGPSGAHQHPACSAARKGQCLQERKGCGQVIVTPFLWDPDALP